MLKKFLSQLPGLKTSAKVKPPVDLNKPVENPRLVKAIDALIIENSEHTRHTLYVELRRAIYLLPFLADNDFHTSQPDSEGQAIIEKGSMMKILSVSDGEGNPLLPLFTDWSQIGAWTKEAVNTMVLPAQDAWTFALNGQYKGVVINPGGNALPLGMTAVVALSKDA